MSVIHDVGTLRYCPARSGVRVALPGEVPGGTQPLVQQGEDKCTSSIPHDGHGDKIHLAQSGKGSAFAWVYFQLHPCVWSSSHRPPGAVAPVASRF